MNLAGWFTHLGRVWSQTVKHGKLNFVSPNNVLYIVDLTALHFSIRKKKRVYRSSFITVFVIILSARAQAADGTVKVIHAQECVKCLVMDNIRLLIPNGIVLMATVSILWLR